MKNHSEEHSKFCSFCGETLVRRDDLPDFIEDGIDWFQFSCETCSVIVYIAIPKTGTDYLDGTVIGLFDGVHKIRQFVITFSPIEKSRESAGIIGTKSRLEEGT